MTVEGIVTKFILGNPHPMITLEFEPLTAGWLRF
jgi:hypothetical protein